jgi:pilus assembly protein CpaC
VIGSHLKDTFLKKETQTVVKVALQFLEVSRLRSESLGIKWPQAEIISSSGAVHIGQQGESGFSGLNYAVNFGTSKTLIQHLITEGAAKIVAAPNLFVRLGENATFHSGGEIPVSSASEGYGRIHRKVDWKPYGLTVKVKPESLTACI